MIAIEELCDDIAQELEMIYDIADINKNNTNDDELIKLARVNKIYGILDAIRKISRCEEIEHDRLKEEIRRIIHR